MWYLLAAEIVLLFLLIKVLDWHANEQQRQRELRSAHLVAVLERIERDRAPRV